MSVSVEAALADYLRSKFPDCDVHVAGSSRTVRVYGPTFVVRRHGTRAEYSVGASLCIKEVELEVLFYLPVVDDFEAALGSAQEYVERFLAELARDKGQVPPLCLVLLERYGFEEAARMRQAGMITFRAFLRGVSFERV